MGVLKMKKKSLVTLVLIAVLAFSLGVGTVAYFKKDFASNNNAVRGAKFEVDSNGTLDKDVEFDLSGDPLYPGINKDAYTFVIDKKGTEVPVRYEIQLTPSDPLFEIVNGKNSPVKLYLYRKVAGNWEKIGGTEKVMVNNPLTLEEFKIGLEWPHTDYDILYQGKTGKIAINVLATQVNGEVPPEDPKNPTITATFLENAFLKNFGYVTVNVRNVPEAAKFSVVYKLSDGITQGETEIVNIGEQAGMIYHNGQTNVDIKIFDQGGNLIHTFTDVTLAK